MHCLQSAKSGPTEVENLDACMAMPDEACAAAATALASELRQEEVA